MAGRRRREVERRRGGGSTDAGAGLGSFGSLGRSTSLAEDLSLGSVMMVTSASTWDVVCGDALGMPKEEGGGKGRVGGGAPRGGRRGVAKMGWSGRASGVGCGRVAVEEARDGGRGSRAQARGGAGKRWGQWWREVSLAISWKHVRMRFCT